LRWCALAGEGRQGGHGAAGRRGVAGVGLDQDLGVVAARHAAAEVARERDGELHVAAPDHGVELGRAARLGGEVEVERVLQRRGDRAGVTAVLLHQHRSRQVARLGVDGVAEQDQLHHRDAQHHRPGDPVAGDLLELLDQHREHAAPRGSLHRTLSSVLPISWMKTSSSVGPTSVQ
jgi:hypothetical protein